MDEEKKKGIPLRAAHNGVVRCLQIDEDLDYDDLCDDLRELIKFKSEEAFTLKWIDEEGDPCTLSSQVEFDEAKRLFYVNGEVQLVINVFQVKSILLDPQWWVLSSIKIPADEACLFSMNKTQIKLPTEIPQNPMYAVLYV